MVLLFALSFTTCLKASWQSRASFSFAFLMHVLFDSLSTLCSVSFSPTHCPLIFSNVIAFFVVVVKYKSCHEGVILLYATANNAVS